MDSHALPIDPSDLALLAEAGIRIALDRDADGRVDGGSIALPIVTHDRPTHVVLALRMAGAGGSYRIRMESEPPSVLIRETREMPLDGDAMHRFGLLGGDARALVTECRDVLVRIPEGPEQSEDPDDLARPDASVVDQTSSYLWGYRSEITLHHASLRDCAYGTESGPSGDPAPAILAAMGRAVAAWASALAAAMAPFGPTPLSRATWTPEAAAHLADPVHGRRRHQAVALHPAFAPFIAGKVRDEATASHVDAGRPFERALGLAIAEWLPPEAAWDGIAPMGWPMAKLRRMRSMPGDLWGPDVHRLLRLARDLPVDHLPSHAEGWRDMAYWTRILDRFATGAGLPLARLVLDATAAPPAMLANALVDVGDMIEAARRHLVQPCLEDRLLPKRGWTESKVAARLLFGGLGLQGILDASAAWHADGILPTQPGSMDWTWPALFPEFEAPNGLRVACLASMRELASEGSHGPDADGREGLAHCIPTYAGQCLASAIHVGSVRRHDGADGWTRVSTVAIVARRAAHGMAVAVRQHRGSRNADPSPEADAAVEALLDFLAHLPMPDAIADPDPHAGRAMGNLEADLPRLVLAWNPFLPRRHRSGSVDEARRLMSGLADAVIAEP